jgi:hypothetical protein
VDLLALWSVLALNAVLQGLTPDPWVVGGLCAIALYFLGVGLLPAAGRRT